MSHPRRPPFRDPSLLDKSPPRQGHVFPLYATRCDRCGLQLMYAGQSDAPACIDDETLRARLAAARVMRRK